MDTGFKDLRAWQKGMELAEKAYRLAKALPKTETYGLADQIKRCAVSVPSNIAEGRGRLSPADFNRFLGIARGSLYELETQVLLARRLELVDDSLIKPMLDDIVETGRILHGLLSSNKARQN